jgi:hypothetical protein
LAGNPTRNPFKIVGNRAVVQGDILPYIKEGILEGLRRGTLPPRLVENGHTETDDEYFAHFNFGSLNIGYEITGLADISYNIYNFTLTGVRKPTQEMSCTVTVSPKLITRGQSVTVSWNSVYGKTLTIEGVGPNLPASGSRTISPTETMSFYGKLSGDGITNECNDIVIVK